MRVHNARLTSIIPLFTLLVVFSRAGFAGSAVAPGLPSLTERLDWPQPVLVAHRGCVEFGPENSVAALKACIAMGIDMVEGDVRATKDGVLVLLHDAMLDRTTDMTGLLNEHTYSEVKRARLRAGSGGKDTALTNEAIPRLSDALEAARGRIFFLLHVKKPAYDEIYAAVLAAGMQNNVAMLIEASPRDPALRKARFVGKVAYFPVIFQCAPPDRTAECYGIDELSRAFEDYRPLHPEAYLLNFESNAVLERNAAVIQKAGARIIASAEGEDQLRDPDALWGPLLAANVALVLTDRASDLDSYLKTRGLK